MSNPPARLIRKVTDTNGNGVLNVTVYFKPPAEIDGQNNPAALFPGTATFAHASARSDGTAAAPARTANGNEGSHMASPAQME